MFKVFKAFDLKSNTVQALVLAVIAGLFSIARHEMTWMVFAVSLWPMVQNVFVRKAAARAEAAVNDSHSVLMDEISMLHDRLADLHEKVEVTPDQAIKVLEKDGEADAK